MNTAYALLHNEYQGHTHPGQCPQDDYLACWDNSITLAVSTDGGKTYIEALPPPAHLIARFPYPGADPSGQSYPVDGAGTGTTSTNRLAIKLEAKCLTDPPSILGVFEMVLWYDADTDTISDNWGDTWNRAR